jgi:chromosome segregation ATPase
MARKLLAGALLGLSGVLLVLSILGVIAAWVYNGPLTEQATARLAAIDKQLADSQSSLKLAEGELQRALRIVNAAQTAIEKLSTQTSNASDIFAGMKDTIDKQVLPGLQKTRTQVAAARTALQGLQDLLSRVNAIPLLNVQIPDNLLQNLIDATTSIDTQIASAEALATQASTFAGDTSYVLGGDLTETITNLQTMLTTLQDYDQKITGWRSQVAYVQGSMAGWIDTASIVLTIFLLWFAFSQFGLFLHGLTLWRGGDPLAALRKQGGAAARETSG